METGKPPDFAPSSGPSHPHLTQHHYLFCVSPSRRFLCMGICTCVSGSWWSHTTHALLSSCGAALCSLAEARLQQHPLLCHEAGPDSAASPIPSTCGVCCFAISHTAGPDPCRGSRPQSLSVWRTDSQEPGCWPQGWCIYNGNFSNHPAQSHSLWLSSRVCRVSFPPALSLAMLINGWKWHLLGSVLTPGPPGKPGIFLRVKRSLVFLFL